MKKLLLVFAAVMVLVIGMQGQSMASSMGFDQIWALDNGTSVFTVTPVLGAGVYFYVWNGDTENMDGIKLLSPGMFGFAAFTVTASGDNYVIQGTNGSFIMSSPTFAFGFADGNEPTPAILSPMSYDVVQTQQANTWQITYHYNGFDNVILVQDASPAPVPVPAAAWLLGSGLIGLVGLRRKLS